MKIKVGDKVRVTRNIKYSFGITLFKGSVLKVISVGNDNTYTCKEINGIVSYALLGRNIVKV